MWYTRYLVSVGKWSFLYLCWFFINWRLTLVFFTDRINSVFLYLFFLTRYIWSSNISEQLEWKLLARESGLRSWPADPESGYIPDGGLRADEQEASGGWWEFTVKQRQQKVADDDHRHQEFTIEYRQQHGKYGGGWLTGCDECLPELGQRSGVRS